MFIYSISIKSPITVKIEEKDMNTSLMTLKSNLEV